MAIREERVFDVGAETPDLDALVLRLHEVKDELSTAAAEASSTSPQPIDTPKELFTGAIHTEVLRRRLDEAERRLEALERRLAEPLPGASSSSIDGAVAAVAAAVPVAIGEVVAAVAAVVPEALEHVRETVAEGMDGARLVTEADLDVRFDELVVVVNRNSDRLADAMHRGLLDLEHRIARRMRSQSP